jgi:hypothetical protein
MTLDDATAFLQGRGWVIMATLEPDGSPWADIVPSLLHQGRLFFRVQTGSRSHANIQRDQSVCCANDQYPTYYEIKGAVIHGKAERIDEEHIPAGLRERPDPLQAGAGLEGECYAVPVSDVVSFDFSKIVRR